MNWVLINNHLFQSGRARDLLAENSCGYTARFHPRLRFQTSLGMFLLQTSLLSFFNCASSVLLGNVLKCLSGLEAFPFEKVRHLLKVI